jgi:hypothetical protein
MALLTDDVDVENVWLETYLGGNGDYYITIINEKDGLRYSNSVRVATSGGNAPIDVKIAVAELHRAMIKNNL